MADVPRRWRVVHAPRVAIRAKPSTEAQIIGVVRTGAEVESSGPCGDNWIELTPSFAPAGAPGWMMVDGTAVGLGPLLQAQVRLPVPTVLFAGARALLVSWDAGEDDMPVALEVVVGADGDGLALRQPEAEPVAGSVASRRIGGLQPDTALSLRLTASLPNGSAVSSAWVAARTRQPATSMDRPLRRSITKSDGSTFTASPDVFGRLRGQPLASAPGFARSDCPSGLWVPAELLHGGLNAAVANFRCGDCCLPPAQHEDLGAAQQPPQPPHTRAAPAPEPEPELAPPLSRAEYLAEFARWDNMLPAWRRLYEPAATAATAATGVSAGDAPAGSITPLIAAVLATSDIHIDFPDNQRWLDALRHPGRPCALILAGDVCTSLTKLRTAFIKLTLIYTHVFYCPGNHELWTAKAEVNSVQKFLDILKLCDECGVHTRPAWVAPGVAIVPLFSWYKTTFFPNGDREELSSREEHFDCSCYWPEGIGSRSDPHLSTHPGIADFFLECNALRFERQDWPSATELAGATTIFSFSHFIPRPELYSGYHNMGKVMGCNELDHHVRHCGASVHIFGHSHLPVDATVSGVRYVQRALGYPRDWGGFRGEPLAIWKATEKS